MPRPPMTQERFLSKTEWQGDCLVWTDRIVNRRGRVQVGGRQTTSNRAAWLLFRGPVPNGMEVCHTCDNPPCVRIDHLFLATHAENMADMVRKGRSQQIALPGARNPWAKFTESEVATIRAQYRSGARVQALATQHQVDRHTISKIVHNLRYRSPG